MLLYRSEHHQPVEPDLTEPEAPAQAHSAQPIINLALSLCGILLYVDGEPRGTFVVLIVLAIVNAVMALRR
jgi:hypothetical protein